MIIIKVKKGESIERALKEYKYKLFKIKQMDNVRERQQYKKKSEKRRETIQKAIYKNKIMGY